MCTAVSSLRQPLATDWLSRGTWRTCWHQEQDAAAPGSQHSMPDP